MCPPNAYINDIQNCNYSVCYSIHPQTCTLSGLESNATTWTVPLSGTTSIYELDMLPSPIEYCLAEPSASHCSVGLNWYFLLVVAVCNALKLICRLLSLRILRKTEDGPDVDGWGPAPQCRREAPVEPSLQLVWQFLSLV